MKIGSSIDVKILNKEFQLFIDNIKALIYAYNHSIDNGISSDYTLKIVTSRLFTVKKLTVENFAFVA